MERDISLGTRVLNGFLGAVLITMILALLGIV